MQPNPIDAALHDELRLADTLEAGFYAARQVPLAVIAAAIRKGSIAPIKSSAAWRQCVAVKAEGLLAVGLSPVSVPLDHGARKGARFALQSISRGGTLAPFPRAAGRGDPRAAARKPILLDLEIAELGRNWARYQGGRLIREIDAHTLSNVRRLIGNASRRLARNPRGVVLDQLAGEIQQYVGLTSRRTQQITKWAAAARRAGNFDAAEHAAKIERALENRARAIASHELATAFNEGTLRAARKAERLRRMPNEGPIPLAAMKQAETVGDERVRDTHTAVADSGPIPLDEVFPIFGADRPPWPGEPGCRCWLVIFSPGGKGPAVKLSPWEQMRRADGALFDGHDRKAMTDASDFAKWQVGEKARGQVKAQIERDLVLRLERSQPELFANNPALANEVHNAIDLWAKSSGDGRPEAVAMQLAINEEFGLAAARVSHWSGSVVTEARALLETESMVGGLSKRKLLRAIVRAQYEATQDWFRLHGISEVTLVRGSNYGSATSQSLAGTSKLVLQPASSFTSDIGMAAAFGDTIHVVTVPVSEILSTARTGFGCLAESEFVMLGSAPVARTFANYYADLEEIAKFFGLSVDQLPPPV